MMLYNLLDPVRTILQACLYISLFCLLPDRAISQVYEQLPSAELYRLTSQLEQSGEYWKAAHAYRILAERDLAEIENIDRAIQNYLEARRNYEKAGDSSMMYQMIVDLGRLYSGSEYYLEAISMFEKVKNYAERKQDTVLQARMLQQIGEVYIAKKQVLLAARYLEEASELNLQIQDTILSEINRLTITALTGQKKLFSDLPDSLRIELTKYDSVRYQSFLPSINLHVGIYNMYNGKYQLAIYYFRQGLDIAGTDSFVKKELYKNLAECYERMADYNSALDIMKKYTAFSDSLNDASKATALHMYRSKDIQRVSELQDLATERNITVLQSKMQKVLSYALLVGVVIMLIVSYIVIRSYQERLNANQIITKQNEEINQRKINELESNLKIETMSSMLQGQEAERERIARDLHDSLGGLLSTVKLHFDAIQAKNPDITTHKEYNKAYTLLDEACKEVRTISNNMQPGALLKMGIVPAINDLVNRIESEDTPNIEFIHYGPLHDLPIVLTLHIYRIVQELLFNSIKHAHAKEILIQLIRNDEDVEIMVEDDGKGYEPIDARKGMGTENISARVNFLKGEISVHSEVGVGTTTSITIPFNLETATQEAFTNIDPEMF